MPSSSHAALLCSFAVVTQGNPDAPRGTRTESAQNSALPGIAHKAQKISIHSLFAFVPLDHRCKPELDFVPRVQAIQEGTLFAARRLYEQPEKPHLLQGCRAFQKRDRQAAKLLNVAEHATTSLEAKTRKGHRQYIGRGPLTGAWTLQCFDIRSAHEIFQIQALCHPPHLCSCATRACSEKMRRRKTEKEADSKHMLAGVLRDPPPSLFPVHVRDVACSTLMQAPWQVNGEPVPGCARYARWPTCNW